MRKQLTAVLIWLLAAIVPVNAQTTLQHNSKVQVKPNGTTTYADALRVWGGGQFGADGSVQTINIDGTLNINSTTVPSAAITKEMLTASGCSSGQILKYSGSAWACDTDIVGGGGGGGTLSSISLVMPSATFDISPGTLTADGTFTVTFDTQAAGKFFAGPVSGSAATPAWRVLDVLDLPAAVVTSSDNEVITGSWRFGANTVFGDSTTAQQLIHVYKATAQAGISIEKGDETERWDILANTNGLQIVEATGGLVPLTFKNNRIGVFNSSPTAGYEIDLTGDFKLSGNVKVGGYFENSLIPSTGDTYNLGDVTRPWSQGYISTINSTIFAESTATLFGGYSIIGKNSGTLATAAASGDTTIYLDKDGTSLPVSGNTWIVIRAHDSSGSMTPKVEYIKLVSVGACSGTAPNLSCPWTVVRDVNSDNSPDPAWPIGTPFLFLGSNGDGRIELNAVSGLPRISILRQSTTATSSTDIIRLGGLDGVAGMSSVTGRYGIFIGEGTTNYMKFQKNVGGGGAVGDDDKLIVQGTINALAGEIGGWLVTTDTIKDTAGLVGLSRAVTGGDDIRFWAGNVIPTSAPFRVTEAGVVSATSGTIGGWTLGTTTLTGSSVLLDSSGTIRAGIAGASRIDITNLPAMKWYDGSNVQLGQIDGSGIRVLPPSGSTTSSGTSAYAFTDGSGGANDTWGVYAHRNAGNTSRYTRVISEVYTSGHDARTYLEAKCSSACGSGSAFIQMIAGATSSQSVFWTDTLSITGDTTLNNDLSVQGNAVGLGRSATALAQIAIYGNASRYITLIEGTATATLGAGYSTSIGGTLSASANGDTLYGLVVAPLVNAGSYTGTSSYAVVINEASGAASNHALYVNGDSEFLAAVVLYDTLSVAGNFTVDSTTLYVDTTTDRVGIGTAPGSYKFHIVGDNSIFSTYIVGGFNTGQSYGLLVDAGSNSTDWTVRFRSQSGTEYLAVRGDGLVGVNTVSPSYTFDVNGTVNATTYRVGGTVGLTTTVVVPCGTLTFTSGLLTNKGTC